MLLLMLRLLSNTRPTETGASEMENDAMSCSASSSKMRKLLLCSSTSGRSKASVTDTGVKTSFTSSRMFPLGSSFLTGWDRGVIDTRVCPWAEVACPAAAISAADRMTCQDQTQRHPNRIVIR